MIRIMNYGKLVAAGAILACTVIAAAQGGGGGGRGGQRGGFGGPDQTGLQSLRRADVQRDVSVTADQKTKIEALQQEMGGFGGGRGGGGAAGGGGGGAGGGGGFGGGGGAGQDPAAMRAAMEKRNAEITDKLGKILSADQMKRLKEVRIQIAKGSAVLLLDVQKDLGLTDAQKTKISDLQTKQREANASLFQSGMSREEMQAARQKNTDALNAELAKVLTEDQAKKLKDMAGKEFKADPPPGGGGL